MRTEKKTFYLFVTVILLLILSGCSLQPQKEEDTSDNQERISEYTQTQEGETNIMDDYIIKIKNQEFKVCIYENETAQAIAAQFPITLNMKDLNQNEKYYFLSEEYPVNPEKTGQIKTGDLMLYGSDCLVLFYQTFSTSYRYTPVGYIEDPNGLENALGKQAVDITFSKK